MSFAANYEKASRGYLARFSSDLQRERSTEDQVAVCREYAARLGFEVVAVFFDRAVTGATRIGATASAAAGSRCRWGVRAHLAETMSRYGRDEEDRAAVRKRLTFHGIKIMTPVEAWSPE